MADNLMAIVNCYEQVTTYLLPRSGQVKTPGVIEGKLGPWAPYASVMNWVGRDRGLATKKTRQKAQDLAKDAADEREKAVRIHRFVDGEWQKSRLRVTREPPSRVPGSLDDVLEWEKNPAIRFPAEEFLWLALSLYQTAGLEAQLVMLPNREFARFDPAWVSPVFLPHTAIALRIGGEWTFSNPHHDHSLPFSMLPWEWEGQAGLLALDRKRQEFVPVPVSPAERTVRSTFGRLELDAEGGLKGQIVRRFTGHSAAALRSELRAANETERLELARKKAGLDLAAAEITVTKIAGLEDADKPFELTFDLRWVDFAVRTKDRMIFRPAVFQADSDRPFSASERKGAVYFPYRWQEFDRLSIQLPAGYRLEAPIAPAPLDSQTLSYHTQLKIEKDRNILHVQREFTSGLVVVPQASYDALKDCYDHIARGDQHELVLLRAAESSVAATP